jgi:hypothetical protein
MLAGLTPVQDVAVALSGGGLDDVMREPGLIDVVGEGNPGGRRVAGPTSSKHGLGVLPRALRLLT